jgi:hypothetical protein
MPDKRVLFVVLFLPLAAWSQTEKGKMLAGGSAELTLTAQGKERLFRISALPSFGYFVWNNFVAGASYSLTVTNSKENKSFSITSGFSPFFRYYVGKKQLRGLFHLGAGYSGTVFANDGNTGSRDRFTARIAAGPVYFFTPYLGMESTFGWNLQAAKGEFPSSRFGFQLGLQVYISRQKKLKPSLEPESTPVNE